MIGNGFYSRPRDVSVLLPEASSGVSCHSPPALVPEPNAKEQNSLSSGQKGVHILSSQDVGTKSILRMCKLNAAIVIAYIKECDVATFVQKVQLVLCSMYHWKIAIYMRGRPELDMMWR